ncbi:MAG: pyridoxal-phosphate dependent enzyme [Anaerolineales bacterium]
MNLPLFENYPDLQSGISHINLCDLPTPIRQLKNFGRFVNHDRIFIKRDDLSGKLFGGNKVRTLEFLLATADNQVDNLVVGLPGTSMALATNIYAHHLNIPVKTVLVQQEATVEAQQNLLYFQYLGADLMSVALSDLVEVGSSHPNLTKLLKIFPGARILDSNSPPGMCGYINAAFELKNQIDEGLLPEPDYLYVPMGLMGTSAGLMLGLEAAGLNTQVICCYIQPEGEFALQEIKHGIDTLFTRANEYLNQHDGSFPKQELDSQEIEIRSLSIKTTPAEIEKSLAWIPRFYALEGIKLDATWTAQAIVSLIHDIENGFLDDQVVLYWHTFNSQPYPEAVTETDYHQLPEEFWHYFEAEELAVVNEPVNQ